MSKARGLADLGNAFDDGALSNRNLIINGAMQVAQRGTSFTGVVGGVDTFSLDRWVYDGTNSATLTLSQDTDAPDGFNFSLKAAVTAADSGYGSGTDYARITQKVEGYNAQQIGLAESWAKPFTVSFWVKSSVAGGYSCTIYSETTNNYHNAGSYQINNANTWEYKSVVFSAHTAGTVGNTTNGSNFRLQFHLNKAGATYSGTQDTWVSAGSGIVLTGTSDQNTWISTDNSTFQITGVQLEVGDTATPFEHPRSYGDELARCKRYFERIGIPAGSSYQSFGVGHVHTSVTAVSVIPYSVEKRATPTASYDTGSNFALLNAAGGAVACTAASTSRISTNAVSVTANSSGLVQGNATFLLANNTAKPFIDIDAEL